MNDIVKNNYGSFKDCLSDHARHLHAFPVPPIFTVYPNVRLEILESHSYLLEDMLNAEADLAFFNLPVKARMLTTDHQPRGAALDLATSSPTCGNGRAKARTANTRGWISNT